MPFLFHSLIALAYAALGAVLAFALPQSAAAVDPTFALFFGGMVVVVGGLIHQSVVQAARSRHITQELNAVSEASEQLNRQFAETRAELHDITHTYDPDDDPRSSVGDEPSNKEVLAEIKVLRTLFAQLATAEDEVSDAEPSSDVALGLSHDYEPRSPAEEEPAPALRQEIFEPVPPKSDYRADWASSGPTRPATHGALALDQRLVTRPASTGSGWGPGGAAAPDLGSNARDILQITRDALERARVSLFLQPIVQLPNRRVAYYEAFSRIRDGEGMLIGPHQYIELAERAGLIGAIDNNLLFRCVQLLRRVRRHNKDYGFFCNMSPHTLGDASFFPQFLEFLGENAELADDLIFEFPQADAALLFEDFSDSLDRLADLGFRFSLDRVERLDLNYAQLARRHFRFIKIDSMALLTLMQDERGQVRYHALEDDLRDARIELIVEKIESERDLVELLDYNIGYGQGYLFGEPRESKVQR